MYLSGFLFFFVLIYFLDYLNLIVFFKRLNCLFNGSLILIYDFRKTLLRIYCYKIRSTDPLKK